MTITLAASGYAPIYFLVFQLNQKREAMSINERVWEVNSGKMGNFHPGFRYTS